MPKEMTADEVWAKIYDFYDANTLPKQQKIDTAVKEQAIKHKMTPLEFMKKFLAQKETKKKTGPTTKPQASIQEDPLPWEFKSDSMSRTDTFITPKGYKSPIVRFTPKTKAVIDYIVANNSQEVGWLGTVKREDNVFTIDNIFIPAQEVSSVETLIDHNAMTALWEEIFSSGGDPSTLFYWGHSHVNMGVSPSGQDEYQVRRFLRGCPVFLRSIHNKAGAIKMDVYDLENRIVSQCVPTSIAYELENEQCKHLDALIKQNVHSTTKYAIPPAHLGHTPAKKSVNIGEIIAPHMYSFNHTGIDDEEYAQLLSDPFYSGAYL